MWERASGWDINNQTVGPRAAQSHNRSLWWAGNRGQRSDLDKSASCRAPQRGPVHSSTQTDPQSVDVPTIESFSRLRRPRRGDRQRADIVWSQRSLSPSLPPSTFFVWHFHFLPPPPAPATPNSSFSDVLSIHCNKDDAFYTKPPAE